MEPPGIGPFVGVLQSRHKHDDSRGYTRMQILTTVAEMRAFRDALPASMTVGFVPTMGAFHAGHESLIVKSREESDISIVSIFVNPMQFAPGEDLATYPRTEEEDLAMCRRAGTDVVFYPKAEEVYPKSFGTFVTTACGQSERNARTEGASRPTFFRGVATVLTMLFGLVRPDKVFFGQKDAQQCAVVRQLVRDLWMDIEVVVGQTVRESDGLAMSSRNKYLMEADRRRASVLYRGLLAAQELVKSGERDAEALRSVARKLIDGEMKGVNDVQFEFLYVSVCERDTMLEVDGEIETGKCVMCVAAMVGKARLIDNVVLDRMV